MSHISCQEKSRKKMRRTIYQRRFGSCAFLLMISLCPDPPKKPRKPYQITKKSDSGDRQNRLQASNVFVPYINELLTWEFLSIALHSCESLLSIFQKAKGKQPQPKNMFQVDGNSASKWLLMKILTVDVIRHISLGRR